MRGLKFFSEIRGVKFLGEKIKGLRICPEKIRGLKNLGFFEETLRAGIPIKNDRPLSEKKAAIVLNPSTKYSFRCSTLLRRTFD